MAKEKILVVDDEEDILELVRYNLAREGYQVTGTLTGEDALRKVRSDTFDLIVLDLMLPGMDGLAFTKTLKNDSRLRSIPIIMLTAKGEEAGRLSATRITVILPNGTVVGDSRETPQLMNNHANRPEIITALADQTGKSLRFSNTLMQRMLYVAVPIKDRQRIVAVLRTS